MADIIDKLAESIRRADENARRYGEIVGRVSRGAPSSISEEGGVIVFDIDPETYFANHRDLASSGSYLAVVDIKTGDIVSLRIISVERKDLLAELNLPDFTHALPQTDAAGLLTRTRITAKPLLAYNPMKETIEAANYVIEPQSPIIRPRDPVLIQRILGLPTEGAFLGYLTIGDKPLYSGDIPLYLPLKAFYQHVLVLGTTGSGKTTLLKNLVCAISSGYKYRGERPSIIIIDPNRDYVHLPLRPRWEYGFGVDRRLEEALLEKTMRYVHHPKGLVIILPVTQFSVSEIAGPDSTWVRVIRALAREYVETIYMGVLERLGWEMNIDELEVVEYGDDKKGLKYAYIGARISYGGEEEEVKLYIIPYSFRFSSMPPKEFISLNPYFTPQAREGLYRILLRLEKEGIVFNDLDEFYAALQWARQYMGKKNQENLVLDPRRTRMIELLRELSLHRATVDNMIRQLGAMIDTGFFDVKITGSKGKVYLDEPSIEMLLEMHHSVFQGYPIVVDLEYLQENSPADPEQAISIAAFRVLTKIFGWKITKSRRKERTQPVIILVDEAHRFFPSRGMSRGEEYVEQVSSMIDRIARLGRARGLGIIFSTHSPKDVHDIILQLTNTKIYLRMDKNMLPYLEVPGEYRDFITRASDRVCVIKTHALRLGYATFRTTLPLAGHYDLSALSF